MAGKWDRPERRSTTDEYGVGTVEVEEDVVVVPPSHLLREKGCALTGGAFLKAINKFLDDYYDGKAVLGRIREAEDVVWEDSGVDRSYYQFFMEYPVIVRRDPFTVFKETRMVKK